MPFKIVLKEDIGRDINNVLGIGKIFEIPSLNIADGLLSHNEYKIPLQHILFIKEV